MRARAWLAAASVFVLAASCVDLFHGTSFETLCSRDPSNAACAGDANTAAADASADAVDLCALGGDPASRAKRACAWLGACEGAKDSSRFGPCYLEALLAYDCRANPALRPRGDVARLWSCLAEIRSCDDVDRCVFGGPVPNCKEIPAGSFTSCAAGGAVRVQCAAPGGGRPATVEPCALAGRTCTILDSSRSACTGAKGNDCPVGTSTCEGTSASRCVRLAADDLDQGIDCAGYGDGRCVSAAQPVCAPSTAAPRCADIPGQMTCRGAVAHVCADSRDVAIDCARLGLGCNTEKASPAVPSSACTGRADASTCLDEDSCAGSALKSCAAGSFHTLDCAEVGLGACVQGASGAATCSRP